MASRTGLVLGGGGAKGAFEAGAVTYLVEEEALAPDVITATSAGSICAAVLGQARTREELLLRVAELHDDLLAMTRTELLFGKQPWLGALEGSLFGAAVDAYVTERTRPPVPGMATFPPPRAPRRRSEVAAGVAKGLPHLWRARRSLAGNTASLLTLDPLAEALRRGASGIARVDPALLARPGLDLRMAVTALGDGVLRFVTGDGTIVAADAVTPVDGPVDVLEGVLASASVPMIFPPRRLGGDVYVDGGVVDVVPVEAAVRLGATRVFAVLAVPLVQPPDRRDFTRISAPGIFLRSVGAISFAGRQLANVNPPLPPGVEITVIDPVVDVVGPFEVAQGLMLIAMDYGWLRAADVLAEVDEDTRRRAAAATDAAIEARTRAWHAEERGRPAGDDKRAVREAVAARKGLGLPTPPEVERWWTHPEAHS